jgi:hypothetical protein
MTALGLTALGLAPMHRSRESRFAVAVGCATTAVAALTLLGVDFGINVLLAPHGAVLEPGPASSWMMVEMPFSTAPIGAALTFSRFEKHHLAAILRRTPDSDILGIWFRPTPH